MAEPLWQYSNTWQLIHCIFAVTYLAVSAPLVIKVLIKSSWPYLAATWRGVLPSLSTQSISPPERDILIQNNIRIHVDSDNILTLTKCWFHFYSVHLSSQGQECFLREQVTIWSCIIIKSAWKEFYQKCF